MNPFLTGILLLLTLALCLYVFVHAKPATLVRAMRAFTATFAALAGTGLLLMGRVGLAIITVSAAIMALRALKSSGSGNRTWVGSGSGAPPGQGSSGANSEIVTDRLAMSLDHQTGDLDGEVLGGPFAGRSLASLGLQDLLQLLAECQRDDPRSVPLLETYLDRHQPEWRSHVAGGYAGHDDQRGAGRAGEGQASGAAMDVATACSVLNVSPTANAEEIKTAHRRLMNKLHPDHGGSSYLAAQLNEAKDVLLGR